MQYLDEYRDRARVAALSAAIRDTVTRPWRLMEVCGGQTHAIVRYGLDRLLPEPVSLIHGPEKSIKSGCLNNCSKSIEEKINYKCGTCRRY